MTEYFYQHHVEREILSALLDGELDPSERRFVHEHLQQCDACRELADELGAVKGVVGDLPRLVAPEAFVSTALERRPPAARRFASAAVRGRRRWILGGAALAAIGITLAGLVTPPPESAPPVDVYVARHISVSNGVDGGSEVLFAVQGR